MTWASVYPVHKEALADSKDHGEYVSIRGTGMLGISQALVRKMGYPPYVELMFNSRDNLIGIKPHNKRRPAKDIVALKMREPQDGRRAYAVHAERFCKYFGLVKPVAIKYPAKWDDEQKFLIVDLNEFFYVDPLA